MKDLRDLLIGMSIKQKWNQKIYMLTILQDFILMLLFKELKDCLLMVLITLLLMLLIIQSTILIIELQQTFTEKYFLPRVNITNNNVLSDGRNFMINQLVIELKSILKLAKLQEDKEMIIKQVVCWIINISQITVS